MATRNFRRFIVRISVVALVFGFAAWGAAPAFAALCYVSPAGSGGCSGWGDTCSLQTALIPGKCSEIWVEKGVYTPDETSPGDQTLAFVIEPNVAVYGGFVGTETTRSERNPAANVSVLSGDLKGNDVHDANGVDETVDTVAHRSDNSNTVVTFDTSSVPVDSSTVLDGFTITAGNSGSYGGGLYCSSPGSCSPTLSNLTFSGNYANYGGGVALLAAGGATSPTMTEVTFSGNVAPSGGAMYLAAANVATASPTLTDVTFSGNLALDGGAIYNESSGSGAVVGPIITNVTFSGNTADDAGGAIVNDATSNGAIHLNLTNVTFGANNAVSSGGAIFSYSDSVSANFLVLTNVILWGDYLTGSPSSGPEIFNTYATPTINHSVVEGGNAGSYRNASGGTDTSFSNGAGNVKTNPLLGPLQLNGGSTKTMALGAGSSAIDTGDETTCQAAVGPPNYGAGGLDQRGVSRPQDGNGDGTAICDIGAYEALLPPVTAIPTLSPWALILLALGLALAATPMLVRRA